MKQPLTERLVKVRAWIASCIGSGMQFSSDPATQQFCLSRLHLWCSTDLPEQKIERELGERNWRPPERLLLVISEKDPLGTLEGFLATYLIGSSMRIKARNSRVWLESLRQALGLSSDECQISDWQSHQQSDEQLLQGIDTVLLAGGEALIHHYRKITPAHIRLIELGPKISGMAILGHQLPPVDKILTDVCLFLQQVCSSPRFILLDDEQAAEQLYQQLQHVLDRLPRLAEEERITQLAKARELAMYQTLVPDWGKINYSESSGWGVTLSRHFTPELWLSKGFQLILSPVDISLSNVESRWPGRLQTLGYWGDISNFQYGGFTRYCSIGRMHDRSLLAPHDGFFILQSLVSFIDKDDYP
ncbi:acyl-CoA synthetase [Jinshanibacter sp. LJY008]|uniref:Acyl-CoA synthetase n=1 Tax=Limnobaculum eriocheiris TaxID=2897391 RepID=A0A9X1SKW0_9GAMM|nr:acyl-CoA reductase [Limnobaculum eriocheiris]MCD1125719.1 acyl-CoA synthetase [Limnobaculum eriocheiris]